MEFSDNDLLSLFQSLSPSDKDAVYEFMRKLAGQSYDGGVTNAFSAEEIGLMMTAERDNMELREIRGGVLKAPVQALEKVDGGRPKEEEHGG